MLAVIQCAWCWRIYRFDQWPDENGELFTVSHGICEDCDKEQEDAA